MNAAATDVVNGCNGSASDNRGVNSFDLTEDERTRIPDQVNAGKA